MAVRWVWRLFDEFGDAHAVGVGDAPGGEAIGAVILALGGFDLVAVHITDGASGAGVEPVAVGVEAFLGEILVVFDAIEVGEALGFDPGKSLHLEEVNVEPVIAVMEEGVAEFVEDVEPAVVGLWAEVDSEGWLMVEDFVINKNQVRMVGLDALDEAIFCGIAGPGGSRGHR